MQLRQGQARRIVVKLRPVHNSGQLPLVLEEVVAVEVGGIVSRNKLQRPLESYQEEDLTRLREVWGETVEGMKERLDDQIHDLAKKGGKNEEENKERHRKLEQSLIERKNCIMEELNQAVVPRPASKISDVHLSGMERRAPVLFLHTSTLDSRDDLNQLEEHLPTVGESTFLPKETGGEFHGLQLVEQGRAGEVGVTAAWDSSVHGIHLNRVTPDHEHLTMVVKVIVRLSEPYPLDLVLKKRVAFTVYKRKSIVNFFRRTVAVKVADAVGQPRPVALRRVGVTYELVGDVPKVFQRVEDSEQVAWTSSSSGGIDENLLEQYTAAITSVETILALERMRQADMVIELDARRQEDEKARSGPGLLKKTVSVPNMRPARSSFSLAASLAGSSNNLSGSNQSLAAIKTRRSLPPTSVVERQQKRLSLPSGSRRANQGSVLQQGTIVEEGDFDEGEK